MTQATQDSDHRGAQAPAGAAGGGGGDRADGAASAPSPSPLELVVVDSPRPEAWADGGGAHPRFGGDSAEGLAAHHSRRGTGGSSGAGIGLHQLHHHHHHGPHHGLRAGGAGGGGGDMDISVRSGRSLASVASSKAMTVHIDVAEDEPAESVMSALEEAYQHPPSRPTAGHMARAFFRKLRGGLDRRLKVPHAADLLFSWIGAFVGIAVVSLLDEALWKAVHFPLLVASFGASAVLLYGVPESKLAQPWNVFVGQVMSSIIGVAIRLALAHRVPWLANALGMSLALVAMQLTTTTHPPGGATALIACSSPITAPWMGFQFVCTVALGSVIMVVVALFTNNVCRDRSYPTYWF